MVAVDMDFIMGYTAITGRTTNTMNVLNVAKDLKIHATLGTMGQGINISFKPFASLSLP